MSERAKDFESYQEQIVSDEELFDSNDVDYTKLDSATEKQTIASTIKFCEMLSGFILYPYQKDFLERIILSLILNDGDTIAGEFARQGGKSTALSILVPGVCIWLPLIAEYTNNPTSPISKFKNGFWCGIYGPDYNRAAIIGNKVNSVLGTRIAKPILLSSTVGMKFPDKLSKYLGHLPRNSTINVKSANKRVSIEGNTYHLCITDETQEISDYVLKKSMSPFLAATNGTMVHIGSAYPAKVYFFDINRQLQRDDVNKNKKHKCYFSADYKVVQKYNRNYKKYIEKEKRKLGEYSDEFKMSYELFWPIEKGMFITEDFLVKQLGDSTAYVSNYDKKNVHSIGIDVGKILDSTVITVMEVDYANPIVVDEDTGLKKHSKKIKNWYEIQGDDYDSQFYQICDFLDNYRWNNCLIDATGVGQALFDRLKNKFNDNTHRVIDFVYTRPDKSYGFKLLQKELVDGRIHFPASPAVQNLRKYKKFVQQMTNLSKAIEGGYLVVAPVDDKEHDDYPNSLMLCNLAAEHEVEMENVKEVASMNIFSVDKVNNKSSDNFWKN